MNLHTEKTVIENYRMENTDDETEKLMDNELDKSVDKFDVVTLEDSREDPFKPKVSLRRSPTRETAEYGEEEVPQSPEPHTQQQNQAHTVEDEGEEVSPTHTGELIYSQTDCLEAIFSLEKFIQAAEAATKVIHEYAKTTKNVKALLKEQSRASMVALRGAKGQVAFLRSQVKILASMGLKPAAETTSKRTKDAETQTDKSDANRKNTQRAETNASALGKKRKEISPLLDARPRKKNERREGTPIPVAPMVQHSVEPNPLTSGTSKPYNEGCDERAHGKEWTTVVRNSTKRTGASQTVPGARTIGDTVHGEPHSSGNNAVKRQPRLRGEAVSLKPAKDMTWADVLKIVKDRVGPVADGINTVRKTISGNLLVEFRPGADVSDFYTKISATLGEGIEAKRLQQSSSLEIMDLEYLATAEEVIEAIVREGQGSLAIKDIRCRVLRDGPRGTKVAIVDIPASKVDKIIKKGKIKIGWVSCRIRRIPQITRCFRCHAIGHMARKCPLPAQEGGNLCRKCGKVGHHISECTQDAKCRLCEEKGLSGTQLGHIAASTKCPIYKEEVAKATYATPNRNGRPHRP